LIYTFRFPLAIIMATFGGLFDFPDLSDSQSELSSPPDSSDDEHSDKHAKDKEDAWYNLPSDSDDSDDDLAAPALLLLASSEIIRLKERNEYKKGRKKGQEKVAVY
jgi:hypothetical protein